MSGLVVGIDIGIKNLAVCAIDTEGVVHEWHLINCIDENENASKKSVSESVRAIALSIDNYAFLAEAQTIAIESQPFGTHARAANNKMRCIQSAVETWCALRNPNALVMSVAASAKKVAGANYAERKRNATQIVLERIKEEQEEFWHDFFMGAGAKKDDLADSFLIANVAKERMKPKVRKRKVRSRTQKSDNTNQEETARVDDNQAKDAEEGEPIEWGEDTPAMQDYQTSQPTGEDVTAYPQDITEGSDLETTIA